MKTDRDDQNGIPYWEPEDFAGSDHYRQRVHNYIPGGAHTYSKGDDQFPTLAPAAIVRGKGGKVWDLDGHEYVDCSLGLGSVSLGHAYEPVLEAVRTQLELGASFQRPASVELEFAEEFVAAIPGAERVKFAKNGSTVTTAAVKLARAYTGKDLVAFPGNHPFYSYDDWFMGKTLCSSGVPDETKALTLTYDSTRPETLQRLFDDHPGRIGCVITEPEEVIPQDSSILEQVASIARRNGAVFVLDEMVSGYRAGWPGAHVRHGVSADMVTWGKGVGNGFSFCALTGRADIMDLGGIKQNRVPRVFLISTTHGGEAHCIAAAHAVLREYRKSGVLDRHAAIVEMAAGKMREAVSDLGLEGAIGVHESTWRVVCLFKDGSGQVSPALRTLFIQEMIRRGVLFQGLFLPCFTHADEDIAHLAEAFRCACTVYRRALEDGVGGFLTGPVIPPVFRKYINCGQSCPADPCPHESECAVGV
jgi:glutamate-1-semialdehyde 2,1-aminomutase